MNDIPVTFSFRENGVSRKEDPIIPSKVIRESLINAIMHRDYLHLSTLRVIKYPNRLEFINGGYSYIGL